MRLGFIGTGAITEALVRGMLRDDPSDLTIVVSARSAEVSDRLAARFPRVVSVAPNNQEIVDGSDIVVLAIRPQIARKVLTGLSFRADQIVVSLVAMLAMDDLGKLVAPARHIVRAIPLPSAAEGGSPTAIIPPDDRVRRFFERVGTVVEADDEQAFDALAAASAIMATHFALAATVASWLGRHGVAEDAARLYVGRILSGLSRTAGSSPDTSFSELVAEHETAGGLNEQVRLHMESGGALATMQTGLDAVYRRIRNGR